MRIQTYRWENCKWTKYIDQKLKTALMMVMMEAKKIILMVLASTWEDVCVWGDIHLHQLVGMSRQGQDATGIEKRAF